MLSAIALSAVIVISPPVTTAAIPRVRPVSDIARQVIEEAAMRSPTIARLLFIIEQSDAIVYVDLQPDLRSEGVTSLVAVNDYCRFIRVAIGRTLTGYRQIEILGHELQHVVEIILAPDVRDSSSLRRLFSRIGWLVTDVSFESTEAIAVERQVRRELRSATAQSKRQKS